MLKRLYLVARWHDETRVTRTSIHRNPPGLPPVGGPTGGPLRPSVGGSDENQKQIKEGGPIVRIIMLNTLLDSMQFSATSHAKSSKII